MGQQSRRKQARRETSESAAFRDHLRAEHFQELVATHPHVDWRALEALCHVEATVVDGEEVLPLVVPRRPPADHRDFDRAVCATGLKVYFRRTMPSDHPGQGIPLDPTTGRPDPTFPVPPDRLGPFLCIVEITPGVRCRRDAEIAMLIPPRRRGTRNRH